MKKISFVKKFNLAFGKIKLGTKRKSPEILLAAGIVGVVGAGVMACFATTKLDGLLDESKEKLDAINEFVPEEKGYTVNDYNDEDRAKDILVVRVKTAAKIAKLYAPAVMLGGLSITSIIGSHYILKERNIALAAALASMGESLKAYRGRVADFIGEEKEKKLYYNIVDEQVVDSETGETMTVTKIGDDTVRQSASYLFDMSNPNYDDESSYNKDFLNIQLRVANSRLQAHGYLFLNDVLKDIGAPPVKEGQVLGWIYDPKDKKRANYIDFGSIETHDGILLNFNCDGNILSDFESHRGWWMW